jgi:antibiotic biosynthesis monooxygenase (ABM) superfamily enzyme
MKIVVERRVRPGAEPVFETWVNRLLQVASRSPGFEGSSVMTVGKGGD